MTVLELQCNQKVPDKRNGTWMENGEREGIIRCVVRYGAGPPAGDVASGTTANGQSRCQWGRGLQPDGDESGVVSQSEVTVGTQGWGTEAVSGVCFTGRVLHYY